MIKTFLEYNIFINKTYIDPWGFFIAIGLVLLLCSGNILSLIPINLTIILRMIYKYQQASA